MRALWHTLAVLTLGLLSNIGFADPPRANHYYWRNVNYPTHYILYDYASRTWVETIDCRVSYRFTLVVNENNYLTIYDASRGMTVKLGYEGMWLKGASDANFSFYQNGTFDTRMSFEHVDANDNYTGTISRTHGCGWEERFPGQRNPAFTFVQSQVTNSVVDMYDRSRDMTVRLDASRMYLRQGNNPFGFFKDGRWR